MLPGLLSAGVFAGLAGGAYLYAGLFPTSQLFGSTLLSGSNRHEIALTFDDGPNDPYTGQLLDLLARHQVRAIFFLVGNYVRRRPDIARAIRQAGHLIGNHTMSHPSLMWERPSKVREELAGCNATIEDAIGERVEWFRPPFGARRPDVLSQAREMGLTPVMWNVTAHDWDATDSHALAARVRRGIEDNQRHGRGSNILLHDGGHLHFGTDRSVTLKTTAMLLDSWSGTDFRLVSLDTWR
ncbi:MAG: polysaccharide deacetylase family protein [Acidobacteriaceae bacterium]